MPRYQCRHTSTEEIYRGQGEHLTYRQGHASRDEQGRTGTNGERIRRRTEQFLRGPTSTRISGCLWLSFGDDLPAPTPPMA